MRDRSAKPLRCVGPRACVDEKSLAPAVASSTADVLCSCSCFSSSCVSCFVFSPRQARLVVLTCVSTALALYHVGQENVWRGTRSRRNVMLGMSWVAAAHAVVATLKQTGEKSMDRKPFRTLLEPPIKAPWYTRRRSKSNRKSRVERASQPAETPCCLLPWMSNTAVHAPS
jgi:hypothetical protein